MMGTKSRINNNENVGWVEHEWLLCGFSDFRIVEAEQCLLVMAAVTSPLGSLMSTTSESSSCRI